MKNIFIINIKPHNWDECEKGMIFGLREGSVHPKFDRGDIFLVRLGAPRPDYGVKAIWSFENEKEVKKPTEVPWTDANYEWLLSFTPLIREFKEVFNEEFDGKSKYSRKIKLNAARLIGAVIKLTPSEIANYLKPLITEKVDELKINVPYLGSEINVYDFVMKLQDEANTIAKKGLPPHEIEKPTKPSTPIEDLVGDPINFRGIVYAPLNEAGVILLFSKVMEELGIFYEASPSASFPDMIGRMRTKKGLQKIFIEFEFKSSNFVQHKHPEQMKEGIPCDYIVCWEHDWPECPIEVIELREVIESLAST